MQDERLDRVEQTVNEIKDNHLPHIQIELTKVGTDVDWVKRFFWIVASSYLSGQYKNTPLFNATGQPRVEPTVLTADELKKLKTAT